MSMIAFNDKFDLAANIRCSDKSLTHRAFILAAIADGVSTISNVTFSQDVVSTIRALEALGAEIRIEGNSAAVKPIALPKSEVTINCGNSGTTARLLAGLVSGLGVKAVFVGDDSLIQRPMRRVVEPLRRLGAQIEYKPGSLFVCQGGSLHGAVINAEVNSAQVKSAVLLAGLFAEGQTEYIEQMPTRNHTELLLAELGADIKTSYKNGKYSVSVKKSRPNAFDVELPNDPSATAYSVALALLRGQENTFTNVLVNPTRMGFYNVLKRSGAKLSICNIHTVLGEQVGDICVKCSTLSPIAATAHDVCDGIDEIPLLATMALFIKGEHHFECVGELVHKECNRVEAIEHMANVVHQQCSFDGANLTVISDGVVPCGKRFKTFDDHRIAMCGAVLSIIAGSGCIDSAPFDISYPQFLDSLGIRPLKLGLIGTNILQSVSPRMQTYLAMQAGVCCSYSIVTLAADVSDAELLRVIDSYDGLNVTMPFKIRVAQLLNADIPAVNTVGKGIVPQSTDGYGLVHSLQKHGVDFVNKPLWIVGAGGAAQSCVSELLNYGCKMRVFNRTAQNARLLRDRYGLPDEVADPVGMLTFIPECTYEQGLSLPNSCKFVFISAYMGYSAIREKAEARGLTVVDGFEMNYFQGTVGFSLWTGTPVQDDYEGYLAYVKEFDYI